MLDTDRLSRHVVDLDQEWTVAVSDPAVEHLAYLESVFAQANGYMGLRGSLEEGPPPGGVSEPYFVVQGVFDQQPGRYETDDLVNLPDWLPFGLWVDGWQLGTPDVAIRSSRRWLDLRTGLLTREIELEVEGEAGWRVGFERFLSMAQPHVAAWRMRLSPAGPEVTVRAQWGFTRHRTNRGTIHFEAIDRGFSGRSDAHDAVRTLQSRIMVAQAQTARAYLDGRRVHPSEARSAEDGPRLYQEWEFGTGDCAEVVVERFVGICTSRDLRAAGDPNPLARAQQHAHDAAADGFALLLAGQRAEWERRWRMSDVDIDTDEATRNALRFCLFQLMQACSRDDPRVAIGAKALSGPGYRGHFFWDTEMFMEPFFAHTDPHAAKNLVMYRHNTLGGARELAAQRGYEGARFAWEGTLDGREQCPTYVKTPDGGEERIVTGEQEDHISADVAYGAWYYYNATGDYHFWRRYGLELLVETARFWRSRAEWNDDAGRWELQQLMGPDEHQEMVDNNAYTNYMVRWNLRTAAAEVTSCREDPVARDVLARLELDDSEPKQWQEMASGIYLPASSSNLIPQHEGFLEEVEEDEAARPKQADVLMLFRLFPGLFPEEVQRANYDFYEPLTVHDSSLSPSVHALVAARVGLMDDAARYFHTATRIDLNNLYANTEDGLHAASLGGAWLAVVCGFCGFHLSADGTVALAPRLHPQWNRVRFRVQARGGLLSCDVSPDAVRLWYDHPSDRPLAVEVHGERATLQPGSGWELAVTQT